MNKFLQKVPESLQRLLIVFVLLLVIVFIVRAMLPPALKSTDIHETKTIEREMAKEIKYAGSEVCANCHDQYNVKKNGYHKNLSCETCHGPAKAHSENPTDIKPAIQRLREFCTRCHQYDPSRPTGFPQINPAAHNPLKPCVSCHNPHDPKPPTTPTECQACHAEIARTKAVSPHVMLECTTCHTTPNEHKIKPREIKAEIPTQREFCGTCHGNDSQSKDIPKIDLLTHGQNGEKYLCWQCHYPHMPEVK